MFSTKLKKPPSSRQRVSSYPVNGKRRRERGCSWIRGRYHNKKKEEHGSIESSCCWLRDVIENDLLLKDHPRMLEQTVLLQVAVQNTSQPRQIRPREGH
ncbi:hypothetical protein KPH14_012495 [Odynerus spinipes]|uniref:Uncharacterized protein n=1 Tax=Odynerus spinipes TaxID=1348599 RepID=A0AAD9RIE0_9HYME|nr:hypothetical protein KPH14_012495 [Odynerus spinipes]